MREDSFPRPVSDPEAEGLPGTADDDSTAFDQVDSPRVADGPDPGMLPLEREDGPVAVDRYGTTPEEARVGEPLELKLRREEPDPAMAEAGPRTDTAPSPDEAEAFDAEPLDTAEDVMDPDTALDEQQDEGVPPPHSPVSMYDVDGGLRDEFVGRLVQPDEGGPLDDEPDAVARDVGAAGGGPSAEELAMHPLEG